MEAMQPFPFSRYKDERKYRRVQATYLQIISLLGNYLSSLILTHMFITRTITIACGVNYH